MHGPHDGRMVWTVRPLHLKTGGRLSATACLAYGGMTLSESGALSSGTRIPVAVWTGYEHISKGVSTSGHEAVYRPGVRIENVGTTTFGLVIFASRFHALARSAGSTVHFSPQIVHF